jgi:hypothetical protein
MKVSFSLFDPYVLKANYKGFNIYNKSIPTLEKNVNINLDLYDLTIDIRDNLGFSPGVNVRPSLTSPEMDVPIDLTPNDMGGGKFLFKNLPASDYNLFISYGRFLNKLDINVLAEGNSATIKFTAVFDLSNEVLDSRGSPINDEKLKINIKRDGVLIHDSIAHDKIVTLPPGEYTVDIYSEDTLIGSETVELTNDKNVKIITKIEPILPVLITGIVIVLIIELIVLLFFKRVSLNTFLKLLAMTLVILSLFQPWWALTATNNNIQVEKNSEMFINPQTMVETITYKDKEYVELSTLPEMFTDFLGTLLLIIYIGIFLLGASFITNILLKKRFFIVLISASIIFMILVALAFSFGMSKITELSLGNLNGEGTINVLIPNGETVNMHSSWGLGIGFYLCVLSALILIAAGVIDFLRRKQWFTKFIKK